MTESTAAKGFFFKCWMNAKKKDKRTLIPCGQRLSPQCREYPLFSACRHYAADCGTKQHWVED